MDKYFRKEAEDFEIKLVDALNNLRDSTNANDDEIRYSCRLIDKKFRTIKKAIHSGNSYACPGDIELLLEDNSIIFLEIKRINKGRGTLANITQDALTKYNIYENLSWSDFREKSSFLEDITSILVEYKKDFSFKNQTDFQNKVRQYKDLEDFAPFKKRIEDIAREDKLSYLKYLKIYSFNKENLTIFVKNIFQGLHTIKNYNPNILNSEINNLYTLYVLGKTQDSYIEPAYLVNDELGIEFPKDTTGVIITQNGKPLIRIAFHWKNVFQGIATPCLNLFDVRGA